MKIKTLIFLLLLPIFSFAQKLVKDIDFDGKQDSVYMDDKESRIVCKLYENE